MKTIPTVQKYMTVQPHVLDANETVATARQKMSEWNIRHLPVMDGPALAGVVSDRDIRLALSLYGADAQKMCLKDACVHEPYQVSPNSPLDEVVAEMAEKRYGCAIVTQNGKVVGIFTTVDACRVLAEILETRYH